MDNSQIQRGLLSVMKRYPLHVAAGNALIWVRDNLENVEEVDAKVKKDDSVIITIHFKGDTHTRFCFTKELIWNSL
jgi:hypothetical protein